MMGANYPKVTNNVSMFRHIDGVNMNRPKIEATMFMLESQSKDVGSTDSCG